MALIKEDPQGITFKVYIQPRSSQNMIVGPHGDAIKIKLTAPPVDNAANSMCVAYLAKTFKIPKSAIDIVSGHNSRSKRIRVRYNRGGTTTRAKLNNIKQRIIALADSQKTA
jgi:uncharacterized protein